MVPYDINEIDERNRTNARRMYSQARAVLGVVYVFMWAVLIDI